MKWTNLTLRTKLIIVYFFSVFIPLLLIAQVILNVSENQIIRQTTELTQESAEQMGNNVQDLLQQYADLVTRFGMDETLHYYLNPLNDYSDMMDSIDAYQYYLKPITYDFGLQNVATDLKIYFVNETLLPGLGIYERIDDKVKAMPEYARAVEAGSGIVWGKTGSDLYVSKAIRNLNGNLFGVVSLRFEEERLYSLMKESDPKERRTSIVDRDNRIVSSNERSLVDKTLDESLEEEESDSGSDYKVIITLIDGKSLPDWRIVTEAPIDSLLKEARQVRTTSLVVTGLTLLLSCCLIVIFLNRIMDRIRKLLRTMTLVKQGKLVKVKDEGGADEIGQLTKNFNQMVEGLESSIEENYVIRLSLQDAQIKKRDAELYALQSQINPHFLFNTLESIRMKLITATTSAQNLETAGMVRNLSKILRKSLNWHEDVVRLEEEMEFVRSYIDIQKARFHDKISEQLGVDESLLALKVPKLIVQPIVENAIKHGIENKKGKGVIAISVKEEGDTVRIVIRDDGIGIDGGRLERIRQALSQTGSERKERRAIGLQNVHDRIALHYGEGYGLTVDSAEGEGTTVTLSLPRHQGQTGENPHV
ncbi:cache domain-containing sensor histidine kinase [Cohnella fermenti]|uniref:histidine kinase n=1 Tax=Cohnella fermenti TaxID=2565925 RepID=A0A4S4BH23_9BACL|nr:sensor histidine kinase [Cohnella fermenti]THF73795.1 sensor histidine kinase [Cohnella fermenti]